MESRRSSRPALSLLIVEDDKLASEVTFIMVSQTFPNVTVYSAENGKMGVELFKKHNPDIVITDINMPGMDGIQMASEIKRINTDTKFIVLTGYSDKNYTKKFSEIGINDYIVKPIVFEKLFSSIERCIDEIRLERDKRR